MFKSLLPILILAFIGCNQSQRKANKKILDFGTFSIEAPLSWNKIDKKGIDSYVGAIAIDSRDTLYFDLSEYSNILYEYDPSIWDSSKMDDFPPDQRSNIIFVKNRFMVDPDKYRKTNVLWDTINGHSVKIVYPRRSGIGLTGIYVDSLWGPGFGVERFNLCGINLQPENEKMLLAILPTLKFYKK